jgi:hypothetical protein
VQGVAMTEKTVDLRQYKRIFFIEADKIEGAAVVAEKADQAISVFLWII